MGRRSGRPHERFGRHLRSVTEIHDSVAITEHSCIQPDLNASLPELAGRVCSKFLAELRKNDGSGMNQDQPEIWRVQVFIKVNRLAQEIVDCGNRLDSSKPASGGDDGHQGRPRVGALEIGFLETLDQTIAKKNGVSKRLHRQGVFFKAGKVVVVRDIAQADDQVIEFQLVPMPIHAVRYVDTLAFEVDLFDLSLEELNPFEKFANRIHDMRHVQIAGGDLVQHRREQKEIILIDERHFDIRLARDRALDLECGVQAAKTATKYDNTFFHIRNPACSRPYSSATSQKILMAPLAFKSLSNSS